MRLLLMDEQRVESPKEKVNDSVVAADLEQLSTRFNHYKTAKNPLEKIAGYTNYFTHRGYQLKNGERIAYGNYLEKRMQSLMEHTDFARIIDEANTGDRFASKIITELLTSNNHFVYSTSRINTSIEQVKNGLITTEGNIASKINAVELYDQIKTWESRLLNYQKAEVTGIAEQVPSIEECHQHAVRLVTCINAETNFRHVYASKADPAIPLETKPVLQILFNAKEIESSPFTLPLQQAISRSLKQEELTLKTKDIYVEDLHEGELLPARREGIKAITARLPNIRTKNEDELETLWELSLGRVIRTKEGQMPAYEINKLYRRATRLELPATIPSDEMITFDTARALLDTEHGGLEAYILFTHDLEIQVYWHRYLLAKLMGNKDLVNDNGEFVCQYLAELRYRLRQEPRKTPIYEVPDDIRNPINVDFLPGITDLEDFGYINGTGILGRLLAIRANFHIPVEKMIGIVTVIPTSADEAMVAHNPNEYSKLISAEYSQVNESLAHEIGEIVFAMLSYEEINLWASIIKEAKNNNQQPHISNYAHSVAEGYFQDGKYFPPNPTRSIKEDFCDSFAYFVTPPMDIWLYNASITRFNFILDVLTRMQPPDEQEAFAFNTLLYISGKRETVQLPPTRKWDETDSIVTLGRAKSPTAVQATSRISKVLGIEQPTQPNNDNRGRIEVYCDAIVKDF